MEKNLKNKYTDSSLLFRLPSHPSQPRVLETKGSIHQELFSPVRSPGGAAEGADREAAFCKTWFRRGAGRTGRDSHAARFLLSGRGVNQSEAEVLTEQWTTALQWLGGWPQLCGALFLQCLDANAKALHCSVTVWSRASRAGKQMSGIWSQLTVWNGTGPLDS